MFEVVFVLIAALLVVINANIYFDIFVLIITVVLIAPGLYSLLKGAPYIPSLKNRIDLMIQFAGLKKGDKIYDLGCGDGRILRRLYKSGFKNVIGYEFSLPTFILARYLRVVKGSKEKIYFKNFWKVDLRDADVIFVFLLDSSMEKFYREIWPRLKKGTKVVSNEFKIKHLTPVKKEKGVYLYVK